MENRAASGASTDHRTMMNQERFVLNEKLRYHSIEIVNSIPATELQTAGRLREHLLDLKSYVEGNRWQVGYHPCEGKAQFFELLTALTSDAERKAWVPILHIECHGSPEGLQLANSDFVTWEALRDYLYALNVATRNHLFVVFGSCWGIFGAKLIGSHLEQGTPFRLVAGPKQETTAGTLGDCFKTFYETFSRTGNLVTAMSAAQQIEPAFAYFSAVQAFLLGWQKAHQNMPKTRKDKDARTERLVTELKERLGRTSVKGLRTRVKKAIGKFDFNLPFESHKSQFFMLNKFPELAADFADLTHTNLVRLLESTSE